MLIRLKLRSRLVRKYITVIAVLVGASLLASGLIELFFSYNENRDSIANLEREKAAFAAATIEQFMDNVTVQLNEVAKHVHSQDRDGLDARRLEYLRLLNQVSSITEVSYLDPLGVQQLKVSRLSLDVIAPGPNGAVEIPYPELRHGNVYFGPVYFRDESEPYISVAVGEPGRESGAVVADVNLKLVGDVVNSLGVGETGNAYAVDSEGTLVVHPDIGLVLQKTNLRHLPQVQRALDGPLVITKQRPAEVTIDRNVLGQRVLTTHHPIQELGWQVFVEQPLNEAFAPLYSSIVRTTLILFGGVALATLTSIVLARRMVAPILALRDGAVRIGAGSLDQSIEVRTGDELEELGDAFNQMSSRLHETYADLKQKVEERTKAEEENRTLAASLEVRVNERTAELGRINEQLQVEISERERTEEQLKHASEAAIEASRAKSNFLASMSHEIRTPMNSIIGMADLLSRTPLNSEQQKYVEVFSKAGDNLLVLINDILDLSKVEAGQLVLENIDFDLAALIEDTVETLAVRADEKGLSVKCDIGPEVPLNLVGDPGHLRQVLINLLGNAIKFTEKGRVSLQVQRDPDSGSEGCLLFRVSDTGIGVSEEQLDIIFDDFTQADSSTTRRYGGTGLGLGISRSLVELMKGRIWVESEVGQGTQVSFTARFVLSSAADTWSTGLPSQGLNGTATQIAQPPPAANFVAPSSGLRILLVDDSEDNRTLVEAYLKDCNCDISTAENGMEAVEMFVSGHHDLVFMDVQMPGMDGYSATRAIREWEREAGAPATPIVALTAHALKEDTQKSIDAGCNGHITKPLRVPAQWHPKPVHAVRAPGGLEACGSDRTSYHGGLRSADAVAGR